MIRIIAYVGGENLEGIKSLRERAGLTQLELATALNVRQASVSRWESGDSMPSADKLPELAKIFGCRIEDLYDIKVT